MKSFLRSFLYWVRDARFAIYIAAFGFTIFAFAAAGTSPGNPALYAMRTVGGTLGVLSFLVFGFALYRGTEKNGSIKLWAHAGSIALIGVLFFAMTFMVSTSVIHQLMQLAAVIVCAHGVSHVLAADIHDVVRRPAVTRATIITFGGFIIAFGLMVIGLEPVRAVIPAAAGTLLAFGLLAPYPRRDVVLALRQEGAPA